MSNLISEKAARAISDLRALLESTKVESITIRTNEEADGALQTVQHLRARKKEIEALREEEVKPLYEQYKEAAASFKPTLDKLDEVCRSFDRAYRDYRAKVEAEARERQRLLDEAAAKERLKKEEEERKARERAEAYADQGRLDKAAEWDSRAQAAQTAQATIAAPIVQAQVITNTRGGFNTRQTFKCRIADLPAVLEHLKKACPPNIKTEIERWGNAQARASRGAASTIPGIVFYAE